MEHGERMKAISDLIEDKRKTDEYIKKHDILLGKENMELLSKRDGSLYEFVVLVHRKQKIEKIRKKNENSINN
jgi:hypothetical protein